MGEVLLRDSAVFVPRHAIGAAGFWAAATHAAGFPTHVFAELANDPSLSRTCGRELRETMNQRRNPVRGAPTPGRTLLFLLLAALATLAVIGGSASAAPSPGGDEVAAAVAFVPSEHVSLTLEGCRSDGTIILPIAGVRLPDPLRRGTSERAGTSSTSFHRLTTEVGNQASARPTMASASRPTIRSPAESAAT